MNITTNKIFQLHKNVKLIDKILLILVAFSAFTAIYSNNWFMLIFAGGWVGYIMYDIRNGVITMTCKAKISDRNLYEAVDKNGNNNYVLASSMDEAELLMETDKINGVPSYIGKVKYFE
jgi:hypothetical protein